MARARAESKRLDWRYYLVKYDGMREGESGIYYAADGELGYSLIMLRQETAEQLVPRPVPVRDLAGERGGRRGRRPLVLRV